MQTVMKQRWIRIIAGIVAALVLLLIVTPFLINADTFRPKVESELTSALGRPVTLGHLSFSLLTGSLVADNVSIADDPAFSTTPFFRARALDIGVSTTALVFSRQVRISNFTAQSPQIQLIPASNGTWNYSSLSRGGSSQSSSSSAAPDLSIGELKIKDGSVTIAPLTAGGKPFVYDHVDLAVEHISFVTPMPFELTADLPGSGTLRLKGTAGPVSQQDAVNTPLQASLEVMHFDPVAAGVVTPGEGISMVADVTGQAASDGKTLTISGNVQAARLKLSPVGTPAAQPVSVDLAVTDDLGTRSGRVSDIAVHAGALAAHITGTYQMTGAAVTLNLHLAAPNLPVDGLEQLLPAVGVRLPSGSSLHGGTLTANLAITGAVASPRIAGPIEIDNSTLAGFDLSSKIEGLMKPGSGSSSGTAIHTLRADVVDTAQSTELNNISADVPSLGTATGSGTVAASGALNFQMVAKLGSSGTTGSTTASATGLGGMAGQFLHTASGAGIPLTITGTTSSPSIRLNTGAMLKQQAGGILKGASGAGSGLSGLKSLIGK